MRDGWLVWEVPSKPVSVRLSLDVTVRLGLAVREGFGALRRRGLETGGLLIGSRRGKGSPVIVDVEDFEPVESEHANGPSYLLSNADRRLLETRITARKATADNMSIVGFYRSHTRSGFAITAEDAALFSSYFSNASDVFLLIKSNEGGPPTGGFIIREGGGVLSNSPYSQFAFDRTKLMPAGRETPVSDLATSKEPPRVTEVVQPLEPTRTDWMVKPPIWLVSAGAMALAAGLYFGIQNRVRGSTPAQPGLPPALNVTNAGNSLRLSWDRQSFGSAGNALLWIKDGQVEQRFEFDSKQLSEGSVTYWPRTSDVTFRLELRSGGASVTESVRAIGGPSGGLAAIPAPAAIAVEPPAAPAVQAPVVVAVGETPVSVRSPIALRRNQNSGASRQHSRVFVFRQPEPSPAAVNSASILAPPTIQSVVGLPLGDGTDLLHLVSPPSQLSDGEGADSSLRVSFEPVSGSRRRIPLIGKLRGRSDYVPPAVLRAPALPNSPPRNVPHDVKIDVKVYVDPTGKVEYSEVLSKVTEANRDLAALAVFEARRWEFVPARTGDGAVPGEVVLHYQFAPRPRVTRGLAGGALTGEQIRIPRRM